MTIHAGGGLVGPTLRELSTGTRVLAVITTAANADTGGGVDRDGQGAPGGGPDYRPGRHTRLRPGDELFVVGPVNRIVDMVRRNQQVDIPARHRPADGTAGGPGAGGEVTAAGTA
ncbi:hypothetical protein [Frankia sp. CcWB3]